ncbi:hypothetical protein HYFRA_00004534 [Hymenoscyphus fraxineus]|uniref:Uncharacterized protein n=1 Tax=Hymenoscyphus fraxineus TaxID=746836 RepID=A0A9N9KYW3_9HELO|nr:hypothetical protein HYFRA_00004534 [Hymenoscyphus fraxineus]
MILKSSGSATIKLPVRDNKLSIMSSRPATLPEYVTSDPPPEDIVADDFIALFKDKHLRTAGTPFLFTQLLRIRFLGGEFWGRLDLFPSMILTELKEGRMVKLEVEDEDTAWYVWDPGHEYNVACAERDEGVTKWGVSEGSKEVVVYV